MMIMAARTNCDRLTIRKRLNMADNPAGIWIKTNSKLLRAKNAANKMVVTCAKNANRESKNILTMMGKMANGMM